MAKILLVEDDAELCDMFTKWFGHEHVVEIANDGATGLDLLKFYAYDLAVLDWELPKLSGPEICNAYREGGGKTVILMLTGKSTIEDKERGFNLGADDYLTKPFNPRELTLRINALLKRPAGRVEKVLQAQDLELDTETHVVRKAGKQVHLMPREFALLEFLMKHPDQPFSPDALLNRVWPSDSEVSTESIKTYISKLRRKLEAPEGPPLLGTVHGVGYKLHKTVQADDRS
jgi:DNA-binding response OmpR family regulator